MSSSSSILARLRATRVGLSRCLSVAAFGVLGALLVAPPLVLSPNAVAKRKAKKATDKELRRLLEGRGPKPFIEPEGFYRVLLPSGFTCRAGKRKVECDGTKGAQAKLFLEVRDVPKSATPEIVMLNQMETFKKKPHFKKVSHERIDVEGVPAVAVGFTYDYMGNVERSVGVQSLYAVQENKLYLVHFEAQLRDFPTYLPSLKELYSTLKFARLDAGGHPVIEDLKPPEEGRNRQIPDPFKFNYGY